ncbi:hypothetical protein AMATHDRAFT_135283 [Amanita thiersii Skay4041]|uniref:JmjC domain-containing protein n=1 Tax=Amanita thiersii Skay4041 TaxID=703135 RepID=A0A2A9P130_9AGAR|nr:hypothetical protein AMATHDRAFT_135283 [Amanita thiersii Skay4041]
MNVIPASTQSLNHVFVSAKGWSLDQILSANPNFTPVPRITPQKFLSETSSDELNEPLIVEGWHKQPGWPRLKFNLDWFKLHGPQGPEISVRNVRNWTDRPMSLSDFLDKSRQTPPHALEHELERLYGKDVECPDEWHQCLHHLGLPSWLLPESSHDLLSSLPIRACLFSDRVKTLMCYIGIGDTFTPCHKDLCASSGQNLMCYTENGGSSLWFMTASKDIFKATQYLHSIEQELDHETHFITIDKLSRAPFQIYVAEQKLGDLVLVPPRSCHQVINLGGITVKTSWSRMTLDGLIAAYYHELPIYQRLCRFETYRVKLTIYHTLMKFTEELRVLKQSKAPRGTRRPKSKQGSGSVSNIEDIRRLAGKLTKLVDVYDAILINEQPHPDIPFRSMEDEDDRITCDFCGGDIFFSFFECRGCSLNQAEQSMPTDWCVICPSCYTDGRLCECGQMKPTTCKSFDRLLDLRRAALDVLDLPPRQVTKLK